MRNHMCRGLVGSIFSILILASSANADCSHVINLATNHFYDSCEDLSKKLVKIKKYEDKISNEEYKLQNGLSKNDQQLDLNLLKLNNSCNNKKLKLLQKISFLEAKLSGFNNCYFNNCNFGNSNFGSNYNNWGYYNGNYWGSNDDKWGYNFGNWYNQSNKLFSLYAKLENVAAQCEQKLSSYEFKTYWWSQKELEKAENKINSYELKIYELELEAVEDYNAIDTFNEVIISCGGYPESCFY